MAVPQGFDFLSEPDDGGIRVFVTGAKAEVSVGQCCFVFLMLVQPRVVARCVAGSGS